MPLTPAQLVTLKADILANANTIPTGQPWTGSFAGQQVKDVPNSGDGNAAIAGWYSLFTTDFRVWRNDVQRFEVYKAQVAAADSTSAAATVWIWAGYKAQSQGEQDSWKEMFMGGSGCDFGAINNRDGVREIFGTTGNGGSNRTHILNVARRFARRVEKLFAVAPTAFGGISPIANNGNVLGDAAGALSNPYIAVRSGAVSGDDVQQARELA